MRRRSSDSTAVAAAACLRWCCRKKNERNDHGAKGTSDNESCTCQERRTLHTFGESVHGIGMALSSLSAAEAKSWAFILYLLFVVALFFICATPSNPTKHRVLSLFEVVSGVQPWSSTVPNAPTHVPSETAL